MSETITWKIKVSGKVQGVFFRASTDNKAKELEVTGWVRNHRDGSVRIIAQGEESDLKNMLKWLQHGPERAVVKQVEWEKKDGGEKYHEFKILR